MMLSDFVFNFSQQVGKSANAKVIAIKLKDDG